MDDLYCLSVDIRCTLIRNMLRMRNSVLKRSGAYIYVNSEQLCIVEILNCCSLFLCLLLLCICGNCEVSVSEILASLYLAPVAKPLIPITAFGCLL